MKSGEAQDRFDFAMGEFEKHKEYLLKKLAIDLRMFLLKVEKLDTGKEEHQVQAYEDFRDIKKDIVNYYTWTKKYQEIFVLEVKNLSVLEERSRSPKKKA